MNVIKRKTLIAQGLKHPNARPSLENWFVVTRRAKWRNFVELRESFGSADVVPNTERVVFNIGGNNYRLIAAVSYQHQVVYIKWFGTHAEYDKIDTATAEIAKLD